MDDRPANGGRTIDLPGQDVLARLALSDSGFVFDPVTGNSFSVNATGLAILRLLLQESDLAPIVEALCRDFDVDPRSAERDVIEFSSLLRSAFK